MEESNYNFLIFQIWMKGDYSRTWLIGLHFLFCHFLTGLGKIPFDCRHFRLVKSAIDLFDKSLNLLPQTQALARLKW